MAAVPCLSLMGRVRLRTAGLCETSFYSPPFSRAPLTFSSAIVRTAGLLSPVQDPNSTRRRTIPGSVLILLALSLLHLLRRFAGPTHPHSSFCPLSYDANNADVDGCNGDEEVSERRWEVGERTWQGNRYFDGIEGLSETWETNITVIKLLTFPTYQHFSDGSGVCVTRWKVEARVQQARVRHYVLSTFLALSHHLPSSRLSMNQPACKLYQPVAWSPGTVICNVQVIQTETFFSGSMQICSHLGGTLLDLS
ncbi:hypothetical protein DFH07DRAFT_766397 [Mycena maculata]|uniref:Uncharacterized protein n=1 Tax=Mycena maculata TaxID=230809 RepID=A0AAD7K6B4_9AGAR|nr:hypothetical protein DFH07DRAFT_766397 [Mycena maculata]